MCGFTGAVWNRDRPPITPSQFEVATNMLTHRGPDASGFYYSSEGSSTRCWLGHRRLSIIDLATGQQPISNETGDLHLIFNGEIYNYQSLMRDLKSRGHQFRTSSDSEVILHLYEDLGPDCLSHLIGMFAFAIWNERDHSLFIARDRLGQKPLFYANGSDQFLCASELKSILAMNDERYEINQEAIDLYLRYQYVPHTTSIYQGINQLPPAHFASWKAGEFRVERYWSPPFAEKINNTPEHYKQKREELRDLLTESVRLRLRSDVPLGSFLSGGVDSTIITGLMARELDQPVRTFSIGFGAREFDESEFAQLAADRLGTTHHQRTVTPDIEALLPRLAWHYDQPFADSSAIPTYYLSQETRQEVTVALTGDGGDEVFGGYDRYRAMLLAIQMDRLPRPLRNLLSAGLWQRIPGSIQYRSRSRRLKRFLSELNSSPTARYFRWISIFRDEQLSQLYTPELQNDFAETDAARFLNSAMSNAAQRDLVTQIMAGDLQTYLPGDILTKVDIASMAHGLECRSPFLDHRVVELAARMPQEWKLDRKAGKRILKETFADLLPTEIAERRKMGFGVPLDHWFRNELRTLVHDVLLSQKALERGYFQKGAIEQLLSEHDQRTHDHASRLWSLLMLELWHRTWRDTPQAPLGPVTL